MKKRRKPSKKPDRVVSYELVMPVFKAGSHLYECSERSHQRAPLYVKFHRMIDGLAIAANDWASGATILLSLREHLDRRFFERASDWLDCDITIEGDGHSITLTGPASAMRAILKDKRLAPWLSEIA